jgi:hypothetical protein
MVPVYGFSVTEKRDDTREGRERTEVQVLGRWEVLKSLGDRGKREEPRMRMNLIPSSTCCISRYLPCIIIFLPLAVTS